MPNPNNNLNALLENFHYDDLTTMALKLINGTGPNNYMLCIEDSVKKSNKLIFLDRLQGSNVEISDAIKRLAAEILKSEKDPQTNPAYSPFNFTYLLLFPTFPADGDPAIVFHYQREDKQKTLTLSCNAIPWLNNLDTEKQMLGLFEAFYQLILKKSQEVSEQIYLNLEDLQNEASLKTLIMAELALLDLINKPADAHMQIEAAQEQMPVESIKNTRSSGRIPNNTSPKRNQPISFLDYYENAIRSSLSHGNEQNTHIILLILGWPAGHGIGAWLGYGIFGFVAIPLKNIGKTFFECLFLAISNYLEAQKFRKNTLPYFGSKIVFGLFLITRAITSPVTSFKEGLKVHWSVAALSAGFSTLIYVGSALIAGPVILIILSKVAGPAIIGTIVGGLNSFASLPVVSLITSFLASNIGTTMTMVAAALLSLSSFGIRKGFLTTFNLVADKIDSRMHKWVKLPEDPHEDNLADNNQMPDTELVKPDLKQNSVAQPSDGAAKFNDRLQDESNPARTGHSMFKSVQDLRSLEQVQNQSTQMKQEKKLEYLDLAVTSQPK